MVTLLLDDSAPSLAVSISTYDPAARNVAVAFREFALTKTTEPGPLTLLQLTESVPPTGRLSSLAVPIRFAAAGIVID